MPISAYGINHQSAPIPIREKLSFDLICLPTVLKTLVRQPAVNEALILSTCNRTEIYTDTTEITSVQNWLIEQKNLYDLNLHQYAYAYRDQQAVRHVIRVASGLDSMILGEPQILGQMKQAYRAACDAQTIGTQLKHLFPAAFAASKQIRTQSQIGTQAISIAYTIVQLSKHIYDRLAHCRVLLIGAGEIISLIATYFYQSGVKNMFIANRTLENAESMATSIQAHVIHMHDIPMYLKECDIVISATASPLPILGKGMIETALKQKKHRPLFLVDLAVPRDIEAEVAALNNVYLYNLDDLQKIIEKNLKNRQLAAAQAEAMVDLQTNEFLRRMRLLSAQHIITHYRNNIETMRDVELQKAMAALQQDLPAQVVLEQFGRNLTNKIMHHPTQQLRKAAENGEFNLMELAKKLFLLE